MKAITRASFVIAALPWLSGCVFWEIRDNIEATNVQLGDVKTTLGDVNTSLDGVNQRLDSVDAALGGVNQRLDTVDTSLFRLDTTNTSLSSVEERLMLLRSIDESMGRLDVHLSSLRKTINRLDGAIPFLDLGGEEPADEPAAPTEVVASDAAPAAAAPASAKPGEAPKSSSVTASASPKRDPIVGTWISAYPSTARAIILQPDNTFVFVNTVSPGSSIRQTGTWSRDRMTMKFIPDAAAAPPPKTPIAAGTLPPGGETWHILTYSGKSITVEGPSGLAVYAKP